MRLVRLIVVPKVPTNQSQLCKLAGCSKRIEVDTFLELIRPRTRASKNASRLPCEVLFVMICPAKHSAVNRQNRNSRVNKAMQRNGGSSRLDIDTLHPPSADGGR